MGIGPWEIVILLIILVVIFGASRLRQISGAMGRSVREFRSAVNEDPQAHVEAAPALPPAVCATCESANPASNKFCASCGATLQPETSIVDTPTAMAGAAETTCPSCATLNPPGQAFCGQCGTRLTTQAA